MGSIGELELHACTGSIGIRMPGIFIIKAHPLYFNKKTEKEIRGKRILPGMIYKESIFSRRSCNAFYVNRMKSGVELERLKGNFYNLCKFLLFDCYSGLNEMVMRKKEIAGCTFTTYLLLQKDSVFLKVRKVKVYKSRSYAMTTYLRITWL